MEPSERQAHEDPSANGHDHPKRSSLGGLRFWWHIVPAGTLVLGVLVFLFGTDVIGRVGITPSITERSDGDDAPVKFSEQVTRFDTKYSFTSMPLIHPKIVSDLLGYTSDTGDQVVAINLRDSNTSNRYFGDVATSPPLDSMEPSWSWVYSVDPKPNSNRTAESGLYPWHAYRGLTWYAYRYTGSTQSGLDVIHARRSSGVAGVENYVVFTRMEVDRGVDYPPPRELERHAPAGPEVRDRELIRLVGRISLGDRWLGTVEVEENDVVVRGRDLYERCESGGVTGLEAAEMRYFREVDCKAGHADSPAPVHRYTAPAVTHDVDPLTKRSP